MIILFFVINCVYLNPALCLWKLPQKYKILKTQILGYTYLYLNKFKRKKRLFCAFIDYEKAFDLVDRTSLWSKLLDHKINGKILRIIYNIYQKAKACVKLGNIISKSFLCNVGVRQGDNISPLLFSFFINDFKHFISRRYKGLTCISTLSRNHC